MSSSNKSAIALLILIVGSIVVLNFVPLKYESFRLKKLFIIEPHGWDGTWTVAFKRGYRVSGTFKVENNNPVRVDIYPPETVSDASGKPEATYLLYSAEASTGSFSFEAWDDWDPDGIKYYIYLLNPAEPTKKVIIDITISGYTTFLSLEEMSAFIQQYSLIIVALIAVGGYGFQSWFLKKRELQKRDYESREERYSKLVQLFATRLSPQISGKEKIKLRKELNQEIYLLQLYAPDNVVRAMNELINLLKPESSAEDLKNAVQNLLLSMRKDLIKTKLKSSEIQLYKAE